MEMISKTSHTYAGRNLNSGDRFEAEQPYAGTLVALGRAEIAGEPCEYLTRDMAAAPPSEYCRRDIPSAPRQKRKYTKRKAG